MRPHALPRVVVLLALLTASAGTARAQGAPGPSATPPRCDARGGARLFGVRASDWSIGCASLGDGRTVFAAMRRGAPRNEGERPAVSVRLAVRDAAGAVSQRTIALGPERASDERGWIRTREDAFVMVAPQDLGGDRGARVGVHLVTGEDVFVRREIALLLRAGSGAAGLTLAWSGEGDRYLRNEVHRCRVETRVRFAFTDAHTLVRTRASTALDADDRALPRSRQVGDCEPPPDDAQTIAVP